MSEIELDVERQVVAPGDVLRGSVLIGGPGAHTVTVSLHGEEVFRPYFGIDTIIPVHEDSVKVECVNGKGEFSFILPSSLSPSYASDDLRCAYYLKAVRAKAQQMLGMSRDAITRMHLTVTPPDLDYESAPHALELKDENLLLEVQVDQISVEAGDSLTGSFLLTRLKDDGALPKAIILSLAAIEETGKGKHRNVIWRMENSVQPTADLSYPLTGTFEFPIDLKSPTSGVWNMFRVHCGFRVRVDWGEYDQRESLPIQIRHRIVPQGPARFAVDKADR